MVGSASRKSSGPTGAVPRAADEYADGLDRRLYAALGGVRRDGGSIVVVRVPQHVEHRAAPNVQHLRDDHERGCLHLAGERACRLPCLPLGGQLVRDWHLRGTDFAVKAVLGLDYARVIREAERLRRLMQRGNNRKIRDCRELDGEVLAARALLPDGAGGNDDIAALYLVHNAAGRADTDERVRAALDQLLHGDGSRRTADAGRAYRNRNAAQRACPQGVLTVVRDLLRVIEILRDLLAPRRVTGQNDVPPDIALGDLNVHLSAVYQHTISPSRSTVLMFFSALLRGSMTSCPQPRHFSLKSIPIRSTCHCLLPHGCCFFMVRMSFTCISIGFTSFVGGQYRYAMLPLLSIVYM